MSGALMRRRATWCTSFFQGNLYRAVDPAQRARRARLALPGLGRVGVWDRGPCKKRQDCDTGGGCNRASEWGRPGGGCNSVNRGYECPMGVTVGPCGVSWWWVCEHECPRADLHEKNAREPTRDDESPG